MTELKDTWVGPRLVAPSEAPEEKWGVSPSETPEERKGVSAPEAEGDKPAPALKM